MINYLGIDQEQLETCNRILSDVHNPVMSEVLDIVARYGTPEEINRKAAAARHLPTIMEKLRTMDYPYVKNIEWLIEERDNGSFVSETEYRERILGGNGATTEINHSNAVTLEISPLQYFPWFIREVEQALEKQEIMPSRYIRLRPMREQEEDGDLLAVTACMQIIGATHVEHMETNGTDGSNVHLGDPKKTLAGYFGGVGQPNDHALQWLDEVLYYYVNFGVCEVINTNNGTIFLGHLLNRLCIDISFKISVLLGTDNPYYFLWHLMMAKMFARVDGRVSLSGLNLSNSVDNRTLEYCARIRRDLGLETDVRLEHHITEPFTGMVRQPYLRRNQLLEVCGSIPNLSAKHEGGEPDIEAMREHPSCHQDNFRSEEEVFKAGDMEAMELSYMDKHDSLNRTAQALCERGHGFIGATKLHSR